MSHRKSHGILYEHRSRSSSAYIGRKRGSYTYSIRSNDRKCDTRIYTSSSTIWICSRLFFFLFNLIIMKISRGCVTQLHAERNFPIFPPIYAFNHVHITFYALIFFRVFWWKLLFSKRCDAFSKRRESRHTGTRILCVAVYLSVFTSCFFLLFVRKMILNQYTTDFAWDARFSLTFLQLVSGMVEISLKIWTNGFGK